MRAVCTAAGRMLLACGCLSLLATSCGRVGYESVAQSEESGDPIDAAVPFDGAALVDASTRVDAAPAEVAVDAGTVDRQACCTDWCQDSNRFGPGATIASESFTATDGACTSASGCTCAVSAAIANTWTVVTGDVCDAHNFREDCPGTCEGGLCPVVTILGRFELESGECICVGTSSEPALERTVWSSTCDENQGNLPFADACPVALSP